MRIEVSVLSPLEPLPCAGRDEALRLLRPGLDGVLLERGRYRAAFLPQMWARFPDPRTFLAQLEEKAGLRADDWDETMELSRYTVVSWHEAPVARAVPAS